MESKNRHDPFGEDEFLGEVAAFETKKPGRKKTRPSEEDVEKIAQARGFDNRTAVSKPVKEPPQAITVPLAGIRSQCLSAESLSGIRAGAGGHHRAVSQNME